MSQSKRIGLMTRVGAVSAAALASLAAPTAHADQSCQALIESKIAYLVSQGSQGSFSFEMSMHRENVAFVSYSIGNLGLAPDGSMIGSANQLFSDRKAGPQPFDMAQADGLDLTLGTDGTLTIHYSPWNFTTTWDLQCKGSMMTTYLPDFGIVTLTFREYQHAVP